MTELVTPLEPLEAMAMRKAVIGSDVGGLRERIQDGVTDLLHRSGDVGTLAARIEKLADDRTLRRTLRCQARAWVAEQRGWKHLVRQYLPIYEVSSRGARQAPVGGRARRLDPRCKRLFVIDWSKALRAAIERSFGAAGSVQPCRLRRLRNVLDCSLEALERLVKASINAAFKLVPKLGLSPLKQQAARLQREHPQTLASLLEGLDKLFTLNRVGLTPSRRRCPSSTNLTENPNARFRNVTRLRSGAMILRRAAASYLEAETRWRRVEGHHSILVRRQALGSPSHDARISDQAAVDADKVAA